MCLSCKKRKTKYFHTWFLFFPDVTMLVLRCYLIS
nr:MAG TPA: hypothetical protein [Caudoviricetes sp.]